MPEACPSCNSVDTMVFKMAPKLGHCNACGKTWSRAQMPDAGKDAEEKTTLTSQEVQDLPDGTSIYVHWSGGNGPWLYTIETWQGLRWAKHEKDREVETSRILDFIGESQPWQQVWLKEPDDEVL